MLDDSRLNKIKSKIVKKYLSGFGSSQAKKMGETIEQVGFMYRIQNEVLR